MHRRGVLSFWEQERRSLPEATRQRFLASPEAAVLASMPDETVRMSIRAHAKLEIAVMHGRWLGAGRPTPAACGCEFYEGHDAGVHKLFIFPGPDSRVGGRGPSSTTVLGRCSCSWEIRAGSRELVRTEWGRHASGEDDEPVEDY